MEFSMGQFAFWLSFSSFFFAVLGHLYVIARWSSKITTIQEVQQTEIAILREISMKMERRVSRLEGASERVLRGPSESSSK